MTMNNLRRVSLSFAALALGFAPIGCSSDAPPSAVVETSPTTAQGQVPLLNKLEHDVDRDVRQTKGELSQEARDIEKSLEGEKRELKATGESIKRSAEGTVNDVLGDPK